MATTLLVDQSISSSIAQFVAARFSKNVQIVTLGSDKTWDEKFAKASPKAESPVVFAGDAAKVGLLDVLKVVAPAELFGQSADDKKEVEKQLKFIAKDFLPLLSGPKDNKIVAKTHKLSKDLQGTVFFVGYSVSIVDLCFFLPLYQFMTEWNDEQKYEYANLTRYFDFLQHQDGISGYKPEIQINKNLHLQFEDAKPKKEQKAPAPAKESQKPAAPEQKKEEVKPQEPKKTEKAEAPKDAKEKGEKKAPAKKEEKKEGDKKEANNNAKKETKKPPQKESKEEKPVEQIAPQDIRVSRLDIRVGKIVACKKVEKSDKLYVEEIDLGEGKPRQIVSGLAPFIPLDQMINRDVLVFCNLKPGKLRGVLSEGMVLAASNSEHTVVELLEPPTGSKIGERVFWEGHPGDADKELTIDSPVWTSVQPGFKTNDKFVAEWNGIPFQTSAGVIKVKSLVNAGIK